jgi:hypothetical protein
MVLSIVLIAHICLCNEMYKDNYLTPAKKILSLVYATYVEVRLDWPSTNVMSWHIN